MNNIDSPSPVAEAEKAIPLDIGDAIKDVPAFKLTVELARNQGTLVLGCGLEETRILKSSAMLADPLAAFKVILALRDEVCAIRFRDLVKMGLKPKKRKQWSECGS